MNVFRDGTRFVCRNDYFKKLGHSLGNINVREVWVSGDSQIGVGREIHRRLDSCAHTGTRSKTAPEDVFICLTELS